MVGYGLTEFHDCGPAGLGAHREQQEIARTSVGLAVIVERVCFIELNGTLRLQGVGLFLLLQLMGTAHHFRFLTNTATFVLN